MYYKSPDNLLSYLDDARFSYLLPVGSISITDEEAKALRPKPPEPTYTDLRASAYPSIQDQLDTIYHYGLDAWKAEIQAVKDLHPKV